MPGQLCCSFDYCMFVAGDGALFGVARVAELGWENTQNFLSSRCWNENDGCSSVKYELHPKAFRISHHLKMLMRQLMPGKALQLA